MPSKPPDPAHQHPATSQRPRPARLFALLLLWDFSSQPPELLEQLRHYIAEDSWARYADRPALRQKVWFSNQQTRQWGAFYLWETEQAREHELATMGRVQAMTGVAPRIDRFDVEAVQEGDYSLGDLRLAPCLKEVISWPVAAMTSTIRNRSLRPTAFPPPAGRHH